jgi:hypothetical protein
MDTQPSDSQYNEVELPPHKRGIDAYAYWFAQQPKDTQQSLIAQGLGPELREGDGNYTFEVKADHQAFSFEEEPAADPLDGEGVAPRLYTDDEVQEVIRRVVMAMQLSESPDCLFQARCILIAFGIGDPPTETELARQRDCSRQFVSKKVKRIQQLFNLSPSQYMRSEAACKAYADAWQRNASKRTIKPSKRLTANRGSHTRPHTEDTSIQMGLGSPQHSSKRNKLSGTSNTPLPLPRGKKSIMKKGGDSGSCDTAL